MVGGAKGGVSSLLFSHHVTNPARASIRRIIIMAADGLVSLPKDPLARFKQSLEDLSFNSKPLIDDLTRAAGQLAPKGDQIVEIIQSRIMQVATGFTQTILFFFHLSCSFLFVVWLACIVLMMWLYANLNEKISIVLLAML